jgi:hypothetical protein
MVFAMRKIMWMNASGMDSIVYRIVPFYILIDLVLVMAFATHYTILPNVCTMGAIVWNSMQERMHPV